MAIQLPPSLQHRHTLVWSGDPALAAPPPGDDEAAEAWATTLRIARETGKWEDAIKPGERPTLFVVKPIPGTVLRMLADDLGSALGPVSLFSTCFRLGVKAIENPDIKFRPVVHPRYGEIAEEGLADQMDAISPAIVNEIGRLLWERAGVPPGK